MSMLAGWTSGALAVIWYTFVTNRRPAGCGQVASGVMSTVMVVRPVESNAAGRKPMMIWPSSVYAELASLLPLITLISRWPDLGLMLAPACGGGQGQL